MKTPIIRRQIISEIQNGDFSTIALMHMAHYDASVQCMMQEAKRRHRPIDVLSVGSGDLWDLHVLIHGRKCKKSDVLRSYHAIDIEYRDSPFGDKLSSEISYVCTPMDLMHDRVFPVKSKSIDLVICTEFIEHIDKESALHVLQEMYRVMRRGGLLYLTTPNADNTSRTDKYHIYEWPLNELMVELTKIGYEIYDVFGSYMDQKKFTEANSKEHRIPDDIVDATKNRFTSNFHRVFLATLYPEYSNGIIIYAGRS